MPQAPAKVASPVRKVTQVKVEEESKNSGKKRRRVLDESSDGSGEEKQSTRKRDVKASEKSQSPPSSPLVKQDVEAPIESEVSKPKEQTTPPVVKENEGDRRAELSLRERLQAQF